MSQMKEQEEEKFLRILTNLLCHEPSKEEMQKKNRQITRGGDKLHPSCSTPHIMVV